jgi:hypothetical protein
MLGFFMLGGTGSHAGYAGGSGVVIIRYHTNAKINQPTKIVMTITE